MSAYKDSVAEFVRNFWKAALAAGQAGNQDPDDAKVSAYFLALRKGVAQITEAEALPQNVASTKGRSYFVPSLRSFWFDRKGMGKSMGPNRAMNDANDMYAFYDGHEVHHQLYNFVDTEAFSNWWTSLSCEQPVPRHAIVVHAMDNKTLWLGIRTEAEVRRELIKNPKVFGHAENYESAKLGSLLRGLSAAQRAFLLQQSIVRTAEAPAAVGLNGRATVLVTGSRLCREPNRALARAIGYAIAKQTDFTILTAGMATYDGDAATLASVTLSGALQALDERGISDQERIRILIPEHDTTNGTRFTNVGIVERVAMADQQARRSRMVSEADAIIVIEGDQGSTQIVDAAWAGMGKAILPLPTTDEGRPQDRPASAARRYWDQHRDHVRTQFQLNAEEERLLTTSGTEPAGIANLVIQLLRRRIAPTCYISRPANTTANDPLATLITEGGYRLLTQEAIIGDRGTNREHAVRDADIVIADLTDLDPTVLYETGFAAAQRKPIVLLHNNHGDGLPLQLRNHHVTATDGNPNHDELRTILATLRKQLTGAT